MTKAHNTIAENVNKVIIKIQKQKLNSNINKK